MALDLAGEKSRSAGAEGTEPARYRHKCRWNKQGTGSNSREKISSAFEGTSREYTGPVHKQLLPVKMPSSRQNAGSGQSSWQTLSPVCGVSDTRRTPRTPIWYLTSVHRSY
jgi:hypothetical protein